jgi:hypothetical protein
MEGLVTIYDTRQNDLVLVDRAAWGLAPGEAVLGHNLMVDGGRQCLSYLLGGKSGSFSVGKVGFGTGVGVPKVTDVALESPIELSAGVYTKLIDGADWPAPFVVRFTFTIGAAECNGYFITELGLFTANNVLIARRVDQVGISKVSGQSQTMSWRLRL